jgi:seryl-tRNA synthetase
MLNFKIKYRIFPVFPLLLAFGMFFAASCDNKKVEQSVLDKVVANGVRADSLLVDYSNIKRKFKELSALVGSDDAASSLPAEAQKLREQILDYTQKMTVYNDDLAGYAMLGKNFTERVKGGEFDRQSSRQVLEASNAELDRITQTTKTFEEEYNRLLSAWNALGIVVDEKTSGGKISGSEKK